MASSPRARALCRSRIMDFSCLLIYGGSLTESFFDLRGSSVSIPNLIKTQTPEYLFSLRSRPLSQREGQGRPLQDISV